MQPPPASVAPPSASSAQVATVIGSWHTVPACVQTVATHGHDATPAETEQVWCGPHVFVVIHFVHPPASDRSSQVWTPSEPHWVRPSGQAFVHVMASAPLSALPPSELPRSVPASGPPPFQLSPSEPPPSELSPPEPLPSEGLPSAMPESELPASPAGLDAVFEQASGHAATTPSTNPAQAGRTMTSPTARRGLSKDKRAASCAVDVRQVIVNLRISRAAQGRWPNRGRMRHLHPRPGLRSARHRPSARAAGTDLE
jgi:hypothetical protein